MNTRRRNYSDDPVTISRCNTRAKKTSVIEITDNSSDEPIPIDLIIEILSRLPAKSVATCSCLSKLWSSWLRRPYFTELFLTRSRTRPQLLFACRKEGKYFFFSSPQPQNPDVNSSPAVCANRLMHFRFNGTSCGISDHVHGLVCLTDNRLSKRHRKETVAVICNPSTGQSLYLPRVKRVDVYIYLVYDPVDKQFKVLSMSLKKFDGNNYAFDKYQILTIGENLSWRVIGCCIPPHCSDDKGICIDGVLYYRAGIDGYAPVSMLVCFDVRSEKFSFIKIEEGSISGRVVSEGNLINYNGKLGLLAFNAGDVVDGRHDDSGSRIKLLVLEDAEKNEWSKHKFVFPDSWQNIVGMKCFLFVGMTRTNEIMFVPFSYFSCVIYYNIERNTITKVIIRGMEAFDYPAFTFLDHVENVNFI